MSKRNEGRGEFRPGLPSPTVGDILADIRVSLAQNADEVDALIATEGERADALDAALRESNDSLRPDTVAFDCDACFARVTVTAPDFAALVEAGTGAIICPACREKRAE
jgi:hypothetical protein